MKLFCKHNWKDIEPRETPIGWPIRENQCTKCNKIKFINFNNYGIDEEMNKDGIYLIIFTIIFFIVFFSII